MSSVKEYFSMYKCDHVSSPWSSSLIRIIYSNEFPHIQPVLHFWALCLGEMFFKKYLFIYLFGSAGS